MKDVKFKIVLGVLIVAVLIIAGLIYDVFHKNKTISYQKYVIQGMQRELDIANEIKSPNQEQIIKLTKEIDELKSQIPKKHPIEIKVQNCMKDCNYTTACMSNCVDNSIDDWEKISKESIVSLKKLLNDEQYALLIDSQTKWETYKNAQQKLLVNTIGKLQGTMYINILSGDIADIYEERARSLSSILSVLKK